MVCLFAKCNRFRATGIFFCGHRNLSDWTDEPISLKTTSLYEARGSRVVAKKLPSLTNENIKIEISRGEAWPEFPFKELSRDGFALSFDNGG